MSKRISLLLISVVLLTLPANVLPRVGLAGTLTAASPLVANVYLGNASGNKTMIYADSDTVTFTQTVVTTADVPNTASAKIDFLDYGNTGSVGYNVSARTETKVLAGGGQSTRFQFTLTTKPKNTNTGTVIMQFRLDSATDAMVIAPQNQEVEIVEQSRGGGN